MCITLRKKMVYQRYIVRGGKRYGPYTYSSKRVNGKVVSSFVSAPKAESNKSISSYVLFVALGVLAVTLLLFTFGNLELTGNVALELDDNYLLGEQITGTLRLGLQEGELIPSETRVLVSLDSEEKEFLLSDLLVEESVISGDYYVSNVDLSGSGSGDGYGLLGSRVIYPEVSFDLLVSKGLAKGKDAGKSSSGGSGGSSEEKSVDEEVEEIVEEEIVEEEVLDEESEVDEEVKEEEVIEEAEVVEEILEEKIVEESIVEESEGSIITGAVVSSNEETISGKASKDNDYSYILDSGEKAELVSGSLESNGIQIGDGEVEIQQDGGEVRVSTEYSVEEEGFGEEFLGKETRDLEIDVSRFGILAVSGELEIRLVSSDVEIISVSEKIVVEKIEVEENVTEDDVEEELEEEIIVNETEINETIVVNETIVINDTLNLGANFTVETTREKIRVGRPVKWVKNVSLDKLENVTLELPGKAENVSVRKKGKKGKKGERDEDLEEEAEAEIRSITGNVVAGENVQGNGLFRFFSNIFRGITGRAITEDLGEDEKLEVVLDDNATEYVVEYYTEAPVALETER